MVIWPWHAILRVNMVYVAADFLQVHSYIDLACWIYELAQRLGANGWLVNKD
jgi:hypothetical protein